MVSEEVQSLDPGPIWKMVPNHYGGRWIKIAALQRYLERRLDRSTSETTDNDILSGD